MIGAKELSEARSERDEGCMRTLIVFRSVNLARVLNGCNHKCVDFTWQLQPFCENTTARFRGARCFSPRFGGVLALTFAG